MSIWHPFLRFKEYSTLCSHILYKYCTRCPQILQVGILHILRVFYALFSDLLSILLHVLWFYENFTPCSQIKWEFYSLFSDSMSIYALCWDLMNFYSLFPDPMSIWHPDSKCILLPVLIYCISIVLTVLRFYKWVYSLFSEYFTPFSQIYCNLCILLPALWSYEYFTPCPQF